MPGGTNDARSLGLKRNGAVRQGFLREDSPDVFQCDISHVSWSLVPQDSQREDMSHWDMEEGRSPLGSKTGGIRTKLRRPVEGS